MRAQTLDFVTDSPDATAEFGARLAGVLRAGDVIGLVGTLGAGKTCLVRGLARGLGVAGQRTGRHGPTVTSPTFVLMRQYEGRLTLSHFDAYRLEGARDMEELGCQEVFDSGGVSVIEWADHVADCLPQEHFLLTIRMAGPRRRELALKGVGAGPGARLDEMAAALADWAA